MQYTLSRHAQDEMTRRAIPFTLLDAVLQNPQQVVLERDGTQAYPSILDFGNGKLFLLRAIVTDTQTPAVVITVYRTSKIMKYWRST